MQKTWKLANVWKASRVRVIRAEIAENMQAQIRAEIEIISPLSVQCFKIIQKNLYLFIYRALVLFSILLVVKL